MHAKIRVEHFDKNMTLIEAQEKRSESFLMGFIEMLYTLFSGSTTYNPPVSMSGYSPGAIRATSVTGAIVGRSLENLRVFNSSEDQSSMLGVPTGIVCGAGSKAVAANDGGLSDPLIAAGASVFNTQSAVWPLLWNMPADFTYGLAYDPATDELIYPDGASNPLVVRKLDPYDGSSAGSLTTDIATGVTFTVLDIESDATHYYISYYDSGASKYYVAKVNKGTGVTSLTKEMAGYRRGKLAMLNIGGTDYLAISSTSYTSDDYIAIMETAGLTETGFDTFISYPDRTTFELLSYDDNIVGKPDSSHKQIIDPTDDAYFLTPTLQYQFPTLNFLNYRGATGRHPIYCWAVYYDGTVNRVMRINRTSSIIQTAPRMSFLTSNAAGGSFDLTASLYNMSASDIDINEVGIVTQQKEAFPMFIARDVLGATVTLGAGETLRVTYTIAAAV